jgi:hypothetical protein
LAPKDVRPHQKTLEESPTLKSSYVQLLDFIANSILIPVGHVGEWIVDNGLPGNLAKYFVQRIIMKGQVRLNQLWRVFV